RNINYTNVCSANCTFCAFKRDLGDADAYVLSTSELHEKIRQLAAIGGTQILLQGGMHPELPIEFYEDMLRNIKAAFPSIHIHGFSPPEIVEFAAVFRLQGFAGHGVPGGDGGSPIPRPRARVQRRGGPGVSAPLSGSGADRRGRRHGAGWSPPSPALCLAQSGSHPDPSRRGHRRAAGIRWPRRALRAGRAEPAQRHQRTRIRLRDELGQRLRSGCGSRHLPVAGGSMEFPVRRRGASDEGSPTGRRAEIPRHSGRPPAVLRSPGGQRSPSSATC
ncbi:MAG: hypothetical protein CME15_09490, partial [Gemmatimonadetes bacterium]|nr:hypothetical protein [Gemmatimonadota bacterium]